jgi:quinol-cytochrome oxidoreductase complex cytochrome b subunit
VSLGRFWRSVFRKPLPNDESSGAQYSRQNFFLHFHPPFIRSEHLKFRHSFCLGGVSFLLFLTACFSGVLLAFYYHPNAADAHNSIIDIDTVMPYGAWWRAIHRWSSELLVLTVFLHMLRVATNRAYSAPREFNWMVGVVLLVLLLFTAFTGYLLPLDTLSADALGIARGMLDNAPGIGPALYKLVFGGGYIGDEAVLRIYVLHCFVLPLAMFTLLFIHFWRVRKDGYKGGL